MTKSRKPLVVLIGPMGSGKSRVGALVADQLQIPFIDTDIKIIEKHGPIADIFSNHSEGYFRGLEREEVSTALDSKFGVISLGGGAVLHPETKRQLADMPVVLFDIDREKAAERVLRKPEKRPLIASGGMDAWQRIYEERIDLYRSLAKFTIKIEDQDSFTVANEVIKWLQTLAK